MKFDKELFNSSTILRKIYTQLYDVNLVHHPKHAPFTFDKICLEGLNILIREVRIRKGKWVAWTKPE